MGDVPAIWREIVAATGVDDYQFAVGSSQQDGGPYIGVFIKLPAQFDVSPDHLTDEVAREAAKFFTGILGSRGVVTSA